MWEKLEDTQNLNKGCRFSQQSSIKSREQNGLKQTLTIDYKQRPFWFDESRRNRESRLNNWESSLHSCEDGEFSVNLLLNGTVSVMTDYCSWLKDGCRWSVGRKVDCYIKRCKMLCGKKVSTLFQQFLALSDVKLHHQLSIWLVLACKVIT